MLGFHNEYRALNSRCAHQRVCARLAFTDRRRGRRPMKGALARAPFRGKGAHFLSADRCSQKPLGRGGYFGSAGFACPDSVGQCRFSDPPLALCYAVTSLSQNATWRTVPETRGKSGQKCRGVVALNGLAEIRTSGCLTSQHRLIARQRGHGLAGLRLPGTGTAARAATRSRIALADIVRL